MTTKRMISIFQYGFWLSLSYLQTFLIKLGKATPLPEHLWKGNSPYGTPGERQLPFWNTWRKATPLPEHLGSPSWFRGIMGKVLLIIVCLLLLFLLAFEIFCRRSFDERLLITRMVYTNVFVACHWSYIRMSLSVADANSLDWVIVV
jgi:hypothetical protein